MQPEAIMERLMEAAPLLDSYLRLRYQVIG